MKFSGWMKLSELIWPEDYMVIQGAVCAVVHLNPNAQIFEAPCIAQFDMDRGFFIATDDTGSYAINPASSGGEVYFYILPNIEQLKISIGELLS